MDSQTDFKLNDGSRIAVIGGGPAGSFFSYFLLDMAKKVGRDIQVDIYEPRSFNQPGPAGCNMCAGVISETLVQYLAAEGINLPPTVVERGIDGYVLHMDVGSARIETPLHEKRIASLHRGLGPRDLRETKWGSFDNYLLTLATDQGARLIGQRVVEVGQDDGRLYLKAQNNPPVSYDLLVVAVGVNTAALKLFEGLGFGFKPPRTAKCFVREYYLGQETVEKYVGSSMHAFLLNIPGLEFAAIIRQGDWGDNMFVIQEGQVEIVVEQDGQEVRLAVQGAGQPIGEMAIFEQQVRSATARALGQARILTVDKKSLLRRVHEDPSLAYYIMQTMSQRVRELNAMVVRRERRQPGTGAAAASLSDSSDCPYSASIGVGTTMCRPPVVLH
jgi:CRP-like cAMP-binding protein